MKNTPFILLILGVAFIWLGLTGRLGAVLAAIFEPQNLQKGSVHNTLGTIPTPAPNNPSFWLPNPFQGIPGGSSGSIPTPEPNNPSFWLPNPFQGL